MDSLIVRANELHELGTTVLERHLQDFLCDDAESFSSNDVLLTRPDYHPDTFSVLDRMNGSVFLARAEPLGDAWIRSLVSNDLSRLLQQRIITTDSIEAVTDFVTNQVLKLLQYEVNGQPVAALLSNQEIPDVVKSVIAYCLLRDPRAELYSHRSFNELAFQLLPRLIEKYVSFQGLSSKELLLCSIASGLVGLDLKGSAAAASGFSIPGIPLRPLLGRELEDIAQHVWAEISRITSRGLEVDHWDTFLDDIGGHGRQMVWFPDDYIESFFDLLLIQKLLSQHHQLKVVFVPKNGRHGNDLAYRDALEFLKLGPFSSLAQQYDKGQFAISPFGPRMGTVHLRKLSPHVAQEVHRSDVVFIKGCRAHELIQGGINKPSYTAYIVAREFSESESGFDARNQPMLFFRAAPGEYVYWGFNGRAVRRKRFGDGREICICHSTIEEHEVRKALVEPDSILRALDQLLALKKQVRVEYMHAFREECRLLVDKIDTVTRTSYGLVAQQYRDVRGVEPCAQDVKHFDRLLDLARELVTQGRLGSPRGKIRLLDVGTGSGRDLRYFMQFPGLEAIGVDSCSNFIAILQELANAGQIPQGSYFEMDMRYLAGFEDCTFDVVRHNATLLHLPMVDVGIGVDAALAESYRVLKPNGLLFVTVKVGNGMQFVDTGEGLGKRFFQFFSDSSLSEVLERNGFRLLELLKWSEQRKSGAIDWLVAYAEKPASLTDGPR